MKNIFKILSIALIGSAVMFAACSKDEEDKKDNNGGGNNTPAAKITYSDQVKANNSVFMIDADSTIAVAFAGGYSNGTDQMEYTCGYYQQDADTMYWLIDVAYKLDGADKIKFPRAQVWIVSYPSPNDPEMVTVYVSNAKYIEHTSESTITTWLMTNMDRENSQWRFVSQAEKSLGGVLTFNMKNDDNESLTAKMSVEIAGGFKFNAVQN